MNIFEKMSAITNELGVVAKNLNVDMGKGKSYKAVQEKDILDAVKPLEEKYKVYSYPIEREIVDHAILEKEGNYGTTYNQYMRIKTTYRFVNVEKPDEYVEMISFADGIDSGDKATGKAMTYADKYALMKAYKIATGDDPDAVGSPENGYSRTNKDTYREQLIAYCKDNKLDLKEISEDYNLNKNSTEEDYKGALDSLMSV